MPQQATEQQLAIIDAATRPAVCETATGRFTGTTLCTRCAPDCEHIVCSERASKVLNIWGEDPLAIDADEFCPGCEHELHPQSDGTRHYEGCPLQGVIA